MGEGSGTPGSDRQAGLADGLGERLHVAVVLVAAAVEHGLADAGGLRPLGEQRAGARGRVGFAEAAQLGLVPGDGGERACR